MLERAYLKDNYLNSYTPISFDKGTKINFAVTTDSLSSPADRFSIVFSRPGVVASQNDHDIIVYPNPVKNGKISLLMKDLPTGIYFVRIVNMLGQPAELKYINHTLGNPETFNTNNLKGIFMLEITGPDLTRQSKKIIID